MTLSDKISILRKEKGFKVAELAEKIRVSDDAVSRWEHGMRVPELDNLIKLADAFDVSLDVFRQDATSLDLPHPAFEKDVERTELLYSGIPLRFGSTEPNERQKEILDFCNAYLATLDGQFFIKGMGQNSQYGTGRYFWERKIDLLMWIGFTPSLQTEQSAYAFSVAVNTETPLDEETLAPFSALQVADNAEENWVYVPIKCDLKANAGRFGVEARAAADDALFSAMKIARKSLDLSLQKFALLKAAENHTKESVF